MKIRFKVLGKSWTLKVILDKDLYYSKKARKGSVAVTYVHKRKICLSKDGVDFETISHELTHAWAYECCIHSCTLDTDNTEEFCAEIISKYGRDILDTADKLKLRVDRLIK